MKRHIAFGDSDADGDVDSSDNTAHTAALTTYNRVFDADLDGDVSNTSGDADKTAWDNAYNEPAASVTMVVPGRGFSPTGNPFLFTGRRLDAETGLYFYRFRAYHPTLKVFLQRDPLGYGASGPSLYQYVGGGPTAAGDPLGLKIRLLGSGSDIQKLLAEIQLVVPQVQLDADGYLKMEKPGDDATFSEWLLWMLIDQATTIAIKKGHIPEKDPHGNKLDPLSPGWTNPDNNVIMVDRSRINMRATGAVIGLWQVIFHELVHAFNNVKKTHDSENCVRWVENMIHRDYERRHPDKKVEDRELDSTDDCPDYEKLIMPPKKKPTEPDGKPPASGPSPKERPVPSVPPLPSRKKPQP